MTLTVNSAPPLTKGDGSNPLLPSLAPETGEVFWKRAGKRFTACQPENPRGAPGVKGFPHMEKVYTGGLDWCYQIW